MSLRGKEQVESSTVNVVSLFGETLTEEMVLNDPLTNLLEEAGEEEAVLTKEDVRPRNLVTENQFPDQSLTILEEQLLNLRTSLNRMKFYLGELEDIIPR